MTPSMPTALRLGLPVDAEALCADVDGLPASAWVPHFNTGIYTGDWSGVPLHMVGGHPDRLFPDPMSDAPPSDTPWMARCPGVRSLLGGIDTTLLGARFLRLGPGASVGEHRDHSLGYEDGEVRLHVPVHTGPGAEFLLDGRLVPMAPGEVWYVDVNQPHAVANRGDVPRVHLVLDCVVNEWLQRTMRGPAQAH